MCAHDFSIHCTQEVRGERVHDLQSFWPFGPAQWDVAMRKITLTVVVVLLLAASAAAQSKRLWVLRSPGEVAEYDPATFSVRQTVKVPAEAVEVARQLRGESSGADAVRCGGVFAAGGRRSGVNAESLVLGWPHRNHAGARGRPYDVNNRFQSGRQRVGAHSSSFSGRSASLLVFKPGAPPAARWCGSFHQNDVAGLAD